MTYQSAPNQDPNAKWTTVISDVFTGQVSKVHFTATEQEGRQWAEDQLNGIKPSPYGQGYVDPSMIKDLDQGVAYGDWGSDYSAPPPPPPKEAKPEVPVKCYCCGADLKVQHQWDHWSEDLTLVMTHCGRTETKRFTLTQAKELAKVGWMAFMT